MPRNNKRKKKLSKCSGRRERTQKQGCFDAYAAVRDAVKQFLSPVPSDGWSGSGNLPVFHWTGTPGQGRADCPGRNPGIAAGRHPMLFQWNG